MSPSGAAYHTYTVQNGTVTVTYADQGLSATQGQQKPVTVMLLEATPDGRLASIYALGAVPLTLTGTTSATITASVTALHADGADRRSTITVSNVRDSLGNLVPDGTKVGVATGQYVTVTPDGCCYNVSAGGSILGGTLSTSDGRFRVFTLQNGQAVFEYSAQGVTVSTGQSTARVQLVSASQSGAVLSVYSIGTVPIQMLAPSSALVTLTPADLPADNAAHLAQLTISNLGESGGATVPDGAKVAITVNPNTVIDPATGGYVQSVGGTLQSAGTTAGDGTPATNSAAYQVYTVADGRVLASYSDVNLSAGVGETKVARVSVVGASAAGGIVTSYAIATGAINLHGTTSATGSGPASVTRTGGTVEITFSGIRDSGGNLVPDGTVVAVTTVAVNQLIDPATGNYVQSTGGSIVNGTASPSNSLFKNFSVHNGSITVTYSAASASVGIARIAVAPALVQQARSTVTGRSSAASGRSRCNEDKIFSGRSAGGARPRLDVRVRQRVDVGAARLGARASRDRHGDPSARVPRVRRTVVSGAVADGHDLRSAGLHAHARPRERLHGERQRAGRRRRSVHAARRERRAGPRRELPPRRRRRR